MQNIDVSMQAPLIAILAGEDSGDQLGADLIAALRVRYPQARFIGIGGARMQREGFEAWYDIRELSLFGFSEVIRHLPRLLRLRKVLVARLLAAKPDVVVGIDAPDFNLGVEQRLKQAGLLTVHYVSPSVWAWREKRAAKIGRSADRVLCLFPMEPAIYANHAVDARFVGHPLADTMPLEPDRQAARRQLALSNEAPVLAVLPGSRLGEIQRLGAIFIDAAARVASQIPDLQVVIPAANAACRDAIEALLSNDSIATANFRVQDGQSRTAMVAADVVLLASGTATLEAMLAKRPMVVGYRIAPLTYTIVKRLGMLKVDRYALPNVLACADLAPELMQDDCTAGNIATAVLHWFGNPLAVDALQSRYRQLHLALRQDASARAADAVAELLDAPKPDTRHRP